MFCTFSQQNNLWHTFNLWKLQECSTAQFEYNLSYKPTELTCNCNLNDSDFLHCNNAFTTSAFAYSSSSTAAFISSGSYAASGGHYQQMPGKPWLLHSLPVELITATAFCTASLHKSSVDFRWFWMLLPVWSLVLADMNTSRWLFTTCFIGSQCHSEYGLK